MPDFMEQVETLLVEGVSLAVVRQADNCLVNLTEMAKPFGEEKKPANWLRLSSTKEYLAALSKLIFSQSAKTRSGKLIFTRNGGIPGTNGTWCTDYRVAMRFAQWLSPKFSVKVDDILVKIARGEVFLTPSATLALGGRQWVDCETYCRLRGKSILSFYGLLGNHPKEFTFWQGVWYVSLDLFSIKMAQDSLDARRSRLLTVA